MQWLVDLAKVAPFTALIVVCAAYYSVKWVVWMPHYLLSRWSRHKCIMAHGWPTAPVDADGDVVYPDADDEYEKQAA